MCSYEELFTTVVATDKCKYAFANIAKYFT